jgi:glycosyltransferase involved in cell wall biosynthesis
MRSAVIHITPSEQFPWWWDEIRRDSQLCELDYVFLRFRGKRGKQITALELPLFMLKALKELLWMRRKYEYVYTVECDFIGLAIAFWQSVLAIKRPRHVILQFIMREKTSRLASRLKYALMTFMFRSLHRAVCSSRIEADYYTEAFGWSADTAQFVPLLTSPGCLEPPNPDIDEGYLVAAGRVFRDYRTAIEAVRGTPFKLIIIGGAGITGEINGDDQVEVLEEIPQEHFMRIVRRASAVIVPLVDTKISTGQTVLLQAMAMGKLVIATRTAGTEDYVNHMIDGVLVEPGNIEDMRRAMCAAASRDFRRELGTRAHNRIAKSHMPHHYAAAIRRAVIR